MKIHIHIERLIVDGVPWQGYASHTLEAALRAELSERFQGAAAGSRTWQGYASQDLASQRVEWNPQTGPEGLGRGLGQTLHQRLLPGGPT